MTARRDGEDFAEYQARRKVENDSHKRARAVHTNGGRGARSFMTDTNRQKKRALVKAMGARQFKIQSRKAT